MQPTLDMECLGAAARAPDIPSPFVVRPYLQFGSASKSSLLLVWYGVNADSDWKVELRRNTRKGWRQWHECKVTKSDQPVADLGTRTRYTANLERLKPGRAFEYRIAKSEKCVFEARGNGLKARKQPVRFVVMGDGADGSQTAARVAQMANACQPDLVLFAGDNVYEDGRISEYERDFFGTYNAAKSTPTAGAPLLSQVPSAAAAGNHDVRTPGFEDRDSQDGESEDPKIAAPTVDLPPDLMGYFRFFAHSDNGPALTHAEIKAMQAAKNKRKRVARFAGRGFINRSNFSLDYGDVHVLVLDGNKYVDWTNEQLRAWVMQDLSKATRAVWKFVVIHQPPFTGGGYEIEERTRMLCDIFQTHGVDVVFSGHCHAYERSYPLRFFVAPNRDTTQVDVVPGTFAIDREYDGKINTRPNGVIYVVTGAAGHIAEFPHQPQAAESTCKLVLNLPSLTMCDVRSGTLIVRQLAADGTEVDAFMIDK
jgi:predicted phosphodiesterase